MVSSKLLVSPKLAEIVERRTEDTVKKDMEEVDFVYERPSLVEVICELRWQLQPLPSPFVPAMLPAPEV
jgi:hypothetical protein